MADPVDPLLPARLRRLSFIVRNETLMAQAWFGAAQSWMDQVRPGVMASTLDSNGTIPPDPGAISGSQPTWDNLVERRVMPVVENTARVPWDATLSGGPVALQRGFDSDPQILDYLEGARNRLRNFPNETYALLQRIIARGVDEGRSIQDVSDEVQQLLTATATDTYRRRAVTVARTETIGAANAGAFAAAQELARETGEENPEKVWLATDDTRTRPTHRTAEGQRVPLMSPFDVGGYQLQFPGDPTGPPQEVIMCRCSFLHVVQGETLDWTDRQFRQDAEDVWDDYDLSRELEGLGGNDA
jgi:uncharacterized protein with gpF-like domain